MTLGEDGAAAVRHHVQTVVADVPSARTADRVCHRRGALDANHRVRRPAPLPG